jgi:hypothetical protein
MKHGAWLINVAVDVVHQGALLRAGAAARWAGPSWTRCGGTTAAELAALMRQDSSSRPTRPGQWSGARPQHRALRENPCASATASLLIVVTQGRLLGMPVALVEIFGGLACDSPSWAWLARASRPFNCLTWAARLDGGFGGVTVNTGVVRCDALTCLTALFGPSVVPADVTYGSPGTASDRRRRTPQRPAS